MWGYGDTKAGAPVTIILEGVTSSCAADQDISPVPDAPLSFVPFLDALQINTLPAGLSIVSNGHELVVALQQSSVSTVYLVKQDGTVSLYPILPSGVWSCCTSIFLSLYRKPNIRAFM